MPSTEEKLNTLNAALTSFSKKKNKEITPKEDEGVSFKALFASELKKVYLKSTSAGNSNKFIEMTEKPNGKFDLVVGEVGGRYETFADRDMSTWNVTYKMKLRMGYKDVTYLYEEEDNAKKEAAKANGKLNADLPNSIVEIIERMKRYAKEYAEGQYDKHAKIRVTKKMLEEAQHILDELAEMSLEVEPEKIADWILTFNKRLLDLFTVLPRAAKISDLLIQEDKILRQKRKKNKDYNLTKEDLKTLVGEIIEREYDTLNALAITIGEYSRLKGKDAAPLLEDLGIDMREKDEKLTKKVMSMLGEHRKHFVNCWYVDNPATKARYQQSKKDAAKQNDPKLDLKEDGTNFHLKEQILWHGSPNQNWISILKIGLSMKYAANGMFGRGLYFADIANKSFGYTSSRSARWHRGGPDGKRVLLALFRVRTGKRFGTYSSGDYTKESLNRKGHFDSVFGKAGSSLMMNEYIVYDDSQADIYALVELKG